MTTPSSTEGPPAKAAVPMRRAMAFMTTTSMLVPVMGVVTAPVLARALGVNGRGMAAAAMAPAALVAATATLGLPEALTYHLARRPAAVGRALRDTTLLSFALGVVCWSLCWAFADFLTGGQASLVGIMLVGTALAVPQIVVGLLRGAAVGLQMWGTVAVERALASILRLLALLALALAGVLDVKLAVLVMSIVPIVAGVAYFRLLFGRPASDPVNLERSITPDVLAFGSRTWLGSVASIVTGRVAQLLTAPLAGTHQLGLLVVAITISDVLFIFITAIRDTLFGVNSRFDERDKLMMISRSAILLGMSAGIAIGVTVPFWIGPIFGAQFKSATVPTWWLLLAAVTNIPGLMAGAGLGAWGRPGLRSSSFVVALLVLVTGFLILVPSRGAVGAGIAAVISGTTLSVFAVVAASRVNGTSPWDFVLPRASDVRGLWAEGRRALARIGRRSRTSA